jgi:hypothetical protein
VDFVGSERLPDTANVFTQIQRKNVERCDFAGPPFSPPFGPPRSSSLGRVGASIFFYVAAVRPCVPPYDLSL